MELTAPPASGHTTRTRHWLHLLAQASHPLGKKALFGKAPNPADNTLLAQLLAQGLIVNLAKKPNFALASPADAQGRFAPLSLARQAVLAQLGLGLKPLALSSSALGKLKGVPPFARAQLRPAIKTLVDEGQLIAFKHGNTSLVLGVAGIRHQLEQTAITQPLHGNAGPPAAPALSPTSLTPQTVREAYQRALPAGGSMVEIGALHRALGGSLAELHTTLRQMLAQRQLFLVIGEPSLLSEADRTAALAHDGQHYHCVELRPL